MRLPILSAKTKDQLLHWFATGNTGVSSKCIAKAMLGIEMPGFDKWTPRDPSDFCRCLKLLRDVPEIGAYLTEVMTPISPEWAKILDHWDEIEECFMEEVPGWMEGKDSNKRASKTFSLMCRCAEAQP